MDYFSDENMIFDKAILTTTRVKRGSIARRCRKEILDFASEFWGAHLRLFRTANQQEKRALACAYVDRNSRKRKFRRLWIAWINATAQKNGITYSSMIHNLSGNQVFPNHKILAQVATPDAYCSSRPIQKISSDKG